jgi:hypothetical protein
MGISVRILTIEGALRQALDAVAMTNLCGPTGGK